MSSFTPNPVPGKGGEICSGAVWLGSVCPGCFLSSVRLGLAQIGWGGLPWLGLMWLGVFFGEPTRTEEKKLPSQGLCFLFVFAAARILRRGFAWLRMLCGVLSGSVFWVCFLGFPKGKHFFPYILDGFRAIFVGFPSGKRTFPWLLLAISENTTILAGNRTINLIFKRKRTCS